MCNRAPLEVIKFGAEEWPRDETETASYAVHAMCNRTDEGFVKSGTEERGWWEGFGRCHAEACDVQQMTKSIGRVGGLKLASQKVHQKYARQSSAIR
jgi:hypothetical protein